MASIENLTSKILEEANARKKEFLLEAEAERNKIIEKKINEAKISVDEIVKKAQLEAKTKKERIVSNAELKVRNKKLEAKQDIISNVFDESINKLCELSSNEFRNFVIKTIEFSDITGEENLILNEQGKKYISEDFIKEINKVLEVKGKKGKIKISDKIGPFKGGFILEKDGIEINNTFEALVDSMKDDLEYEVAQVLFS